MVEEVLHLAEGGDNTLAAIEIANTFMHVGPKPP